MIPPLKPGAKLLRSTARDRDRAADPAAVAQARRRREYGDAVRSRHRAIHHGRRQAGHRLSWSVGATPP